jgi:hypothetical protein
MKKGLIILGSIVVLIVGYLFWYYTSSADDEIHILPKGFTGIVIIRFNIENGKKELYKDGKRVYEIPPNGILETKFKVNEGWSNPPEYYYLNGKERINLGNNKVYSPDIGVAISDMTHKEVTFVSYIVSDEKHVDSLYTVRERINIADAR